MTLKERKELFNKDYNELKTLESKYDRFFKEVAIAYMNETNWEKSRKLMDKMDVIKNDRAAIYKAIEENFKKI